MATKSFDKEYILKNTPENRTLFKKLTEPSKNPAIRERHLKLRKILERIRIYEEE